MMIPAETIRQLELEVYDLKAALAKAREEFLCRDMDVKRLGVLLAEARAQVGVMLPIAKEIQSIMQVYREQEASKYGVGTPGGLEHMGDVWRLLTDWDKALSCLSKEARQ